MYQSVFSCDCKSRGNISEAREKEYEANELIFLGRLISVSDDGTFKLEVIETLKGKDHEFVIAKYEHSCSILPRAEQERWLIYMNEPSENHVRSISVCGLSRSFDSPCKYFQDFPPPKPFPRDYQPNIDDYLNLNIENVEFKKKCLTLLQEEIQILRNRKG